MLFRLPLNATSVQLVGEKGGVEKGRAANLIQLFGGAVTVKLSSAAVPDQKTDDTILIGPPFYLEVCAVCKPTLHASVSTYKCICKSCIHSRISMLPMAKVSQAGYNSLMQYEVHIT